MGFTGTAIAPIFAPPKNPPNPAKQSAPAPRACSPPTAKLPPRAQPKPLVPRNSAPGQYPGLPTSPDATAPSAKQIHPQCCTKSATNVKWRETTLNHARKTSPPCQDSTLEKTTSKRLHADTSKPQFEEIGHQIKKGAHSAPHKTP